MRLIDQFLAAVTLFVAANSAGAQNRLYDLYSPTLAQITNEERWEKRSGCENHDLGTFVYPKVYEANRATYSHKQALQCNGVFRAKSEVVFQYIIEWAYGPTIGIETVTESLSPEGVFTRHAVNSNLLSFGNTPCTAGGVTTGLTVPTYQDSQEIETWNLITQAYSYDYVFRDRWSDPEGNLYWVQEKHRYGSGMGDVVWQDATELCATQSLALALSAQPENVPIRGLAADGSARVTIDVTAPTSDPITVEFKLANGEPFFGTNAVELVPSLAADGEFRAKAQWTAPDGLPDPHRTSPLPVQIWATQAGATTHQDVLLYQPPVYTLHGVWSKRDTWGKLRDYLKSKYPVAGFFLGGYEKQNHLSFRDPEVQRQVLGEVSANRAQLLKEGILADKFDVVGHSMGGLVALQWAGTEAYMRDSPSKTGWFRNLVSVGTPAKGSPIANSLLSARDNYPSGLARLPRLLFRLHTGIAGPDVSLADLMASMGMTIACVTPQVCAVDEFALGGGITPIVDGAALPWRGVRGIAPDRSTIEVVLDALMGVYSVPPPNSVDSILDPLFEQRHDTIVPLDSENAGASVQVDVTGVVHASLFPEWIGSSALNDIAESESDEVLRQVTCHLQRIECPPAPPGAAAIHAPTKLASPTPFEELMNIDGTGLTELPASALSITPDTSSPLTVQATTQLTLSGRDGFSPTVFYVWSDLSPIVKYPGSDALVSVRPVRSGPLEVKVIALDANGNYSGAVFTFVAEVPTPGVLSLSIDPAELELWYGGTKDVRVTATYSDYAEQLPAGNFSASVLPGGEGVILAAQGTVTGLAPGSAVARFAYGGKYVDLPVRVVGDTTIFSSGFE